MGFKEYFADKKSGFYVSLIGVFLSLLTAVVYAVCYGAGNTAMDNMSWVAFWLLLSGVCVSIALFFCKQFDFISPAMSIFQFIAFLFFVWQVYPYVAAALTGIDSTWEIQFFLSLIFFLGALIVNILGVFLTSKIENKFQRSSVPVTALLLGILLCGTFIAEANAPVINSALHTQSYKIVESEEDGDESSREYYKSQYKDLSSLIKDGQALCEEVESEGIVLLKNDNVSGSPALPLKKGERKISLFGISSVDPVYGGTGSGAVDTAKAPTLKAAMERNDLFDVNDTLWNWYNAGAQEKYKRQMGSTGAGVTGIKVIGEAPWDIVSSDNEASFAAYGDAAVIMLSRVGGEGSDMPRGTRSLSKLDDSTGSGGDSTEGDYLKLSPKEKDLLAGVKEKKDAGIFKRVIVLLNTANQIEADFLDSDEYGIDAALWIGTPGQTGMYAVAEALAGNVNPSGSLMDTFWRTHDKNPALANFGVSVYDGATDTILADGSYNQDKVYVVYQEGIYLGYKYAETRYEDYVMGKEKVGLYDYAQTISYPFGYGLSYSSFEYSGFKMTKDGENENVTYTISVDVTNNGPYKGKDTVQIYLQKPYGNYNVQNGVEAASVELVGFAKTDVLDVGETKTVNVKVKERQFASYDANNAGTYVITEGNYFLTAASDAHSAVNNILSKKGYTPKSTSDRMDADGNADMVTDAIALTYDSETYSKSEATGVNITNQFSYADWNKYENRGSASVKYTTRNDWEGTTAKNWDDGVVLPWNDKIKQDEDSLGREGEIAFEKVDTEYPAYETFKKDSSGADIKLQLIDLRVFGNGEAIPYDSELWDQLLDQLSWSECVELIRVGMRMTGKITSIGKYQTLDHNGPTGLTESYRAGSRGLANRMQDPLKSEKAMCYPCSGILAATMNVDLIFKVGNMIGEDALWAGYNGLYGPGSNIHRTPYSGRNFEYYSEDGYLSGVICAYECAGMEKNGLYVYNKHIGLNDQEDMRRGISTWANEQSIREIYMRAFELPIIIEGAEYNFNGEKITLKGASGVMMAFNRMGLHWSGMQKGLVTNFLREECGMHGIAVTDMWANSVTPYMNIPAMLMAGVNLVDGTRPGSQLEVFKPGTGHGDVAWAMRESVHRILYTVVHSNAMNGIAASTKFVDVMPWWEVMLISIDVALGALFIASAVWTTITLVRKQRKA